MNTPLKWSEQDAQAVDVARVLAADAVDKVGNGHPGTAISLAPAAYLLYQKVMKGDPADPRWIGRDRFVLSAGHASILQYNELFLAGYGLELSDIESLRTWGSLTPGHPEFGHTAGVETTTGPLGAGISNMVGMAMAAKRERALLDPDAPAGESIFDRFIFGIAGDGCMQEGIASESASLAGALGLGNIVLIYDDNHITIEGDTKISFTEDVLARHEAYGWHTQHVDWTHGGTQYAEDVPALYAAIEAAMAVTDKPSIIKLTTVIGWPLPHKAGSHSVHGSKIGAEETAALKEVLGMDPTKSFDVSPVLLAYTRANAAARAAVAKTEWSAKHLAWRVKNPERAALLDRLEKGELPEGFEKALPVFAPGKKATRAASGEVLTALADVVPELWGGSADLAGSNNTTMKGQPSFLAPGHSTDEWQGDYNGRTMHFGIREHAMGGVINGIAQSGLTRPYGGTFLVFSDYMRPTARLAALQKLPSTFVWTHDSIGVGEDGPTHQPIEHLAALRVIPDFDVVRPADANEVSAAWAQILRNARPATIVLSRQDLPIVDRENGEFASTDGVAKGGYILKEASADPQVILIGTGSEVQLAVEAAARLEAEGIPARVVSMPCVEWFNEQDAEYKTSVLPGSVVKVSVEAGVPTGWREIVGDSGRIIGIDHFGASANGALLFEKFGITTDAVYAAAKDALA